MPWCCLPVEKALFFCVRQSASLPANSCCTAMALHSQALAHEACCRKRHQHHSLRLTDRCCRAAAELPDAAASCARSSCASAACAASEEVASAARAASASFALPSRERSEACSMAVTAASGSCFSMDLQGREVHVVCLQLYEADQQMHGAKSKAARYSSMDLRGSTMMQRSPTLADRRSCFKNCVARTSTSTYKAA